MLRLSAGSVRTLRQFTIPFALAGAGEFRRTPCSQRCARDTRIRQRSLRDLSRFFSEEAQTDLLDLYDYIADHGGDSRAIHYIERIEECCQSLRTLPKRGTARDDIRPGLRIIGFEHRVTIAFDVDSDPVTILRILYAGRDVSGILAEPES